MELHQIQVIYRPDEDRLLCRASFKESDEFHELRAWLTRRLVRNLWPAILLTLEKQVALEKPDAAHASSDIVGMEHQASVDTIRDNGSFDAPYETEATHYPLGETPILVEKADLTVGAGQPVRINVSPAEGRGFEISFDLTVLHGFCALLQEAVAQADWDMALEMPGLETPAGRILN
jgi:hypothetical protein